jgi:hypothetical protein
MIVGSGAAHAIVARAVVLSSSRENGLFLANSSNSFEKPKFTAIR